MEKVLSLKESLTFIGNGLDLQPHVVQICKCRQKPGGDEFEKEEEYMETIVQKFKSWRWRVAYLALFGMITQIMHRNCISFALVCMCKDGQTHNASHLHSYGKSEEIIPDLVSMI